jgi:hypothetical protein
VLSGLRVRLPPLPPIRKLQWKIKFSTEDVQGVEKSLDFTAIQKPAKFVAFTCLKIKRKQISNRSASYETIIRL